MNMRHATRKSDQVAISVDIYTRKTIFIRTLSSILLCTQVWQNQMDQSNHTNGCLCVDDQLIAIELNDQTTITLHTQIFTIYLWKPIFSIIFFCVDEK